MLQAPKENWWAKYWPIFILVCLDILGVCFFETLREMQYPPSGKQVLIWEIDIVKLVIAMCTSIITSLEKFASGLQVTDLPCT